MSGTGGYVGGYKKNLYMHIVKNKFLFSISKNYSSAGNISIVKSE
jgi:hypothetical protein